jgi:hypothetical protein
VGLSRTYPVKSRAAHQDQDLQKQADACAALGSVAMHKGNHNLLWHAGEALMSLTQDAAHFSLCCHLRQKQSPQKLKHRMACIPVSTVNMFCEVHDMHTVASDLQSHCM